MPRVVVDVSVERSCRAEVERSESEEAIWQRCIPPEMLMRNASDRYALTAPQSCVVRKPPACSTKNPKYYHKHDNEQEQW